MSTTASEVRVHRYSAAAMPVNAYLVETSHGVVVVDTTLTVSDGSALRARLQAIDKPLQAVLATHAHPDHYGGAVELIGDDEIPFVAAEGVARVIHRDDEVKEQIIRPMFGEEWPRERRFPNETATDGQTLTFDGVPFTLLDLGPGESPHDSVWLVGEDRMTAFAGDSAYEHMHCYLADGFWKSWLVNIARLRSELSLFLQNIPESTLPAIDVDGRFYLDAGEARISMVELDPLCSATVLTSGSPERSSSSTRTTVAPALTGTPPG